MWFQLDIENCTQDEVETISLFLEEEETLSITLTDRNDDPVLEPAPGTAPLWPEVNITALFAEEETAQRIQKQLQKDYPQLPLRLSTVADQQWERVWMDDFKPMTCGNRLWICPSWCTPPEPTAVNLILDPGLAFGTGTHPTTMLCLQWLDGFALEGKRVIDYGCGSGILGLAALKLGAGHVDAIDIDPQALQATLQNAQNNGLDLTQLNVTTPEEFSAEVNADLIIANILLTPLLELKNQFHSLLKAGGTLVLSGILAGQAEQLASSYQDSFVLMDAQTLDGWSLAVFQRV